MYEGFKKFTWYAHLVLGLRSRKMFFSFKKMFKSDLQIIISFLIQKVVTKFSIHIFYAWTFPKILKYIVTNFKTFNCTM